MPALGRRPLSRGGTDRTPAGPQPRRLTRGIAVVGALGLLAAGAAVATATVTTPNPTTMKAMGPVSGEHGFPTWYEDSNGLRLEQCLDLEQDLCDPVFLRGEMPSPGDPISFPDNWPLESFYMAADSVIDLPGGGGAGLTLALEATFTGEEAVPGEQIVFGRVRIRIDAPSAGEYKVIHPYGVDTFQVEAGGTKVINMTEDVGIRSFAEAMRSRINPFLVRSEGPIVLPNGDTFIGDPAVPTTVTGSPLGTNVFRIEGPDIGGPGVNVIQTDLFSLMGKVSTNDGVDAGPVTYTETETAAGGGYLDVYATAGAGDAVTVSGSGVPLTTLQGDGARYHGRIAYTGAPPTELTVTNASDKPPAVKTVPVTDQVVVSSATYDTDADTLTVQASSSDQVDGPTLTMTDPSTGAPLTLTAGSATVTELAVPPASVTVTSTAGGTDIAPVVVGGAASVSPDPVTVAVVAPTTVPSGALVTLDGSSSRNATSYLWTQTGGPNVALEDPTAMTTTFAAPTGPADIDLALTVEGPGGPATQEFTIHVLDGATPPVAEATASPTSAMAGQQVTVDGSTSTNASSYAWSQTSGTPVTFDTTARSFSFAMPAGSGPLTFSLTVTSPTGVQSEPATVVVTPIGDTLTVTAAEFRTGKREWRVDGTSTITNNNTVSVYLRTSTGDKGALVGTAQVDTLGAWGVRVRGGVNPPAGTTGLIVESSRGGSTTATYTTRG